jgi:LysM repeat protein
MFSDKSQIAADVDEQIEPPTPRAAGEISNCTMWLDVPKGITCKDLMVMNNLQFGEFYKMNPSVGADCSGLVVGTNYCRSTYPGGTDFGYPGWSSSGPDEGSFTATSTHPQSLASTGVNTKSSKETGITATRPPSPVQTGILESCTKFHKVEKEDTCYDIANDSKITLDTFYKWNPAVKTDCSALVLGTYVCVRSS